MKITFKELADIINFLYSTDEDFNACENIGEFMEMLDEYEDDIIEF